MPKFVKLLLIIIVGCISVVSIAILIAAVFVTTRYPETVIKAIEAFILEKKPESFTMKGVAVIGDSLSDEYRGDDSRGLTYAPTTLNWVELLQKYRRFNFGPWGRWGEPRRSGFAYNWSRTGATTNSMFESGQDAGIVEQIKKGEVNLVIFYIGANDFAPYITSDGYDAIYNGSVTDRELLRKKNTVVSDIKTAIDTVQQAGNVKILLIKIPDWGNHFGVRVAFPLPEQRKRISDAVASANGDLQQIADERNIPTVDPNLYYQEVFGGHAANIIVGKETFNAILPSDDPRSVFLEDGVHPGTVLNGLFANYIIRALNKDIGTSVTVFSSDEILKHAGL